MLRILLIAAIAAPMLSGCIIIATDEPTTRVITTSTEEGPGR